MTDPFGFWWMFATAEERKEYAETMNKAVSDMTQLVVLPAAALVVLISALII